MAINGQTLTLKLSLTSPSLITQSRTALHTSRWISKLLKIEGAGQIDFCGYQLLLLTQSENMIGKHRPPPLHLVSDGKLMGGRHAFQREQPWLPEPELRKRHFRIINTDADPPLPSQDLWIGGLVASLLPGFSCVIFAASLWCVFTFVHPLRHIAFRIRGGLFSIFPVHFLRAISCISGSPDIEAKARNKLSQFLLRHNPTDASSVIGFLSLHRFLFHSFSGLLALPYSLHLSLRHWPLGSTEQNWFRVFHGSWMRQQLCNGGRDGERKGLNK